MLGEYPSIREILSILVVVLCGIMGSDSLILAQTGGERVVYISPRQAISGVVANMNNNPEPKKLLLGAWFKPQCSRRVSIPSKKWSGVNRMSGSLSALWYSEKDFDDNDKRTVSCGIWVAVGYLFDIKSSGRFWNELDVVYAIGAFDNDSSNVDIKLGYTASDSPGPAIVLLDAPSGVTIYNPFYFISYTDDKGSDSGRIGATLFEVLVGAVNPNPLLAVNFFKYFSYPPITYIDEANDATAALTDVQILAKVAPKGFMLEHAKSILISQAFKIQPDNPAIPAAFQTPCVDMKFHFDQGTYVSTRAILKKKNLK